MPDNKRFKDAVYDLNSVFGEDPQQKNAFAGVNNVVAELEQFTERFYKENILLTAIDIESIREKYSKLLDECDRVLFNENVLGQTGYGRGGIECVKVLRNIAAEDMRALMDAFARNDNNKTLLDIVQEGRSISANIETNEKLKTVGGQMSSRIPLRLNLGDGKSEECFFTESYNLRSYEDQMDEMKKEASDKYGPDSVEYKITDFITSFSYDKMIDLNSGTIAQEIERIRDPEKRSLYYLKTGIGIFKEDFQKIVSLMDEDLMRSIMGAGNEDIRFDPNEPMLDDVYKKRMDYFMDQIVQVSDKHGFIYMYKTANEVPIGANIDKRNIAMSTVADFIGIGNTIAGARNFELTVNGKKIKGTLQQKANGVDKNRLPENHEFYDIAKQSNGNRYETSHLESGKLKRDLADLMALDYICGNTDRHEGNMLYKTERDANGKLMISGVVGIDNDMSFGNITYKKDGSKITEPEKLRVMRASTASKILHLTPEKIDFILKDMNFSAVELKACHTRLKKLQNRIKEDIQLQNETGDKGVKENILLILEDNEFDNYKFTDFCLNKMRTEGNYFDYVFSMSRNVIHKYNTKNFDRPEKNIEYQDALAEKGFKKFSTESPKVWIDIKQTSDQIAAAKRSIDELGSKMFGKDSGHFTWMKETVEKMDRKFKEMMNGKQTEGALKLTTEEAVKLESMFRQLKHAGDNYIKTHKKNPLTPTGKGRRRAAVTLSGLEIKYSPEKAAVDDHEIKRSSSAKKLNMNEVMKKIYGEEEIQRSKSFSVKKSKQKSKTTAKTDIKNMDEAHM